MNPIRTITRRSVTAGFVAVAISELLGRTAMAACLELGAPCAGGSCCKGYRCVDPRFGKASENAICTKECRNERDCDGDYVCSRTGWCVPPESGDDD